MQPEEIGFLEWAFKGVVGAIFVVGWWMWGRLVSTVVKTQDDLNTHKLHVSETYAKKEELKPIYACLTDIQNDVKELLGRKRSREE